MPAPLRTSNYTYAEYVAFEASSNVKHEFFDGQIYAMAGGTPEHAALAWAFAGQLYQQLRDGSCGAFNSDLRVHTPSGLATYPDVTVICGPTERDPADALAVTNPTVIIEVLSRGTEEYDRGDKFEHYKSLPSLRQYVLVAQRERAVEVWTRGESGSWRSATAREGDVAELLMGARIDVRELYRVALERSA